MIKFNNNSGSHIVVFAILTD